MTQLAKLFRNGRSQAVRLPAAFRFNNCKAVYIRKDPQTGDLILSAKPNTWNDFLELAHAAREITQDFMRDREDTPPQDRDLL